MRDSPENKDQITHPQLSSYLDYYLSLPYAPQFAVMIEGPWGVGKTFAVRKYLEKSQKDGDSYIYVSLFGAQSAADIDSALLFSLYPLLDTKVSKFAGKAVKIAFDRFVGPSDVKVADVLPKLDGKIIVFDDMERCSVPIEHVLGYINQFVEHDGCKVLILANETEIKTETDYIRKKEKVVGKTITLAPNFDEAFAAFLSHLENKEARDLLTQEVETIRDIWSCADTKNLRVLQHTMWDFERLFLVIEEKHKGSTEAVKTILKLFFAFSFEIKAGRLEEKDLKDRLSQMIIYRMKDSDEEFPIVKARARYPTLPLDNTILADDVLIDLLIKGRLDRDRISQSIDMSSFFASFENQPSWVMVWHLNDLTEEEFNRAYNEMQAEFEARQFVKPGEILHVFGLKLRLAEMRTREVSKEQVMNECRTYVDGLVSKGTLTALDGRSLEYDHWDDSYEGLGFCDRDSEEFKGLQQYLFEKRKELYWQKLPEAANTLLETMKEDVSSFARQITFSESIEPSYYNREILHCIEPIVFVRTYLSLHPRDQMSAIRALSQRYVNGELGGRLKKEKDWLNAVYATFFNEAKSLPPMSQARLKAQMKIHIAELVTTPKSDS